MTKLDIVDIRNAIKNGLFRVYISKGIIYLKDMDTEEIVQIGKVNDND
jgi:hypothetical protein